MGPDTDVTVERRERRADSEPISDTRSMLGYADGLWSELLQGVRFSESQLLEATRNYPYLQSRESTVIRHNLQYPSSDYSEFSSEMETPVHDISSVPDDILMGMLNYAANRLPREVMSQNVMIDFDANFDSARIKARLKPANRSRGYYLNPIDESTSELTMEVRTITDYYEVISCLGIIAAVRSRLVNLKIELEYLEANTWELPSISFDESEEVNLDELVNQKRMHSEEHLETIRTRLSYISNTIQSFDPSNPAITESFPLQTFVLLNAKGSIPKSHKLKHTKANGKESYRCPHAAALAQMAAVQVNGGEREKPHVLFFSNTFTYINTLASGILHNYVEIPNMEYENVYSLLLSMVRKVRESVDTGELPVEILPKRILDLVAIVTNYEKRDEKGRLVVDPNYKEMAISTRMVAALLETNSVDFLVDFYENSFVSTSPARQNDKLDSNGKVPNRRDNNRKVVTDFSQFLTHFQERVYSEKFMNSLGLRVLVNEKDSPTCDGVHYIDFSKLSGSLLNEMHPLIRDYLRALKEQNVRFIVLPYALGDLSSHLIGEFSETGRFNIRAVAEMGKLGLISLTNTAINVGDCVEPISTIRMGNGENGVSVRDIHPQPPSSKRAKVLVAQAPTVLWQTLGDVLSTHRTLRVLNSRAYHKGSFEIPYIDAVCAGMEHDAIAKGALERKLPFVAGDYLSDTIVSEESKIGMGGLGVAGTQGLLESFGLVLRRVTEIINGLERARYDTKIAKTPLQEDHLHNFGRLVLRALSELATLEERKSYLEGLNARPKKPWHK